MFAKIFTTKVNTENYENENIEGENYEVTVYAQKIRLQVTFISKKPKIVNLQV